MDYSFDIFLDDERRLVRVVVKGEVFQAEGEKIITTARETAAKYNYNILCDMRAATTTVDFARWYRLPRDLEVFNISEARKTKSAVIILQTDTALEGYKFYETVSDNLGFKTRIFFEEAEALQWLDQNCES